MSRRAGQPTGEGRLVVGLVRGVHGLRGAVRVEVLSDDPRRFEPGTALYPEGSSAQLTVAEVRREGPGLIVHFAEVPDRDAADLLRDTYLETDAPASLPSETYFWHQVMGCEVFTSTGESLGRVDEVARVGEAEVYVVHGPRGELLVPAVQAIVRELSPAEGRIVVDPVALGIEEA